VTRRKQVLGRRPPASWSESGQRPAGRCAAAAGHVRTERRATAQGFSRGTPPARANEARARPPPIGASATAPSPRSRDDDRAARTAGATAAARLAKGAPRRCVARPARQAQRSATVVLRGGGGPLVVPARNHRRRRSLLRRLFRSVSPTGGGGPRSSAASGTWLSVCPPLLQRSGVGPRALSPAHVAGPTRFLPPSDAGR
jgi:hypothetical protein